ncbi:FAD-dependent oxidoreductase [Pseudophaeobacter sp.]|uniref:glycerol-3-phosphate dehydrogenase/oxidase n=1 Tax=Pseudophaeobacter sp. TaxID=1971739 RepID=UPI003A969D40
MSKQRQNSLAALSHDDSFDVVVLGGGINGIGVYRDLALQGLRVLLVERNDFCSGCSAAPSRMIHGGLRYLENGEFDLVKESLAERDALLRNAPHYVQPLPTTIPITSLLSGTLNAAASFLGWSGKPSRRGALPIKLGLGLYDWVTRSNRVLPKHQFHSAGSTRRARPALTPDLLCSATYYDAWISHPERLGLEMILDVEQHSPASQALNYAELTPEGENWHVIDSLTGDRQPIKTRVIVNATGAWLDSAISALNPGAPRSAPLVSGTKGSHLILDNASLMQALDGHMIYFENDDGRVCIVFPYLGKVLAGSTDIRVETAQRVRCEAAERDYILASLGRVFPDIALSADQIVFSYSGIRPLPKSDHDYTGRISRGHDVRRINGTVPQFCMIGGKWTTFRAFAEQTSNAVLQELKHPRQTCTRALAIGGGAGFASAQTDAPAQGNARTDHLLATYGSRATEVAAFCAAFADDRPLTDTSPTTTGEIAFLARHEHVVTLSDIVLRRSPLAITGQISTRMIDRICAVLRPLMAWSQAETTQQKQDLLAELNSYYGVSQDMLDSRN